MRKRILTLALALAMCLSLAVPVSAASKFSDVPDGAYYAKAVSWAVGQNIVNGMTTTTFGPGRPCTTAHILAFLWRGAGRPGGSADMSWTDELTAVTAWARGKGIDVPADLDTACTRASSVTYMWKAAGSPPPKTTAVFTDVPASANYAKAVSWAVEQGITEGTGNGAFSPDRGCDRGQIVTFLYREKVEPLRVYTTDPSIYLTMTECNFLRVRESDTSYDFSSTRVCFDKAWSNAHGTGSTVTWSVDDPSVLSLNVMTRFEAPYWLEFVGEKPGSARITCHVVGGDGYAAEAYCYVTVLGAGEPAPIPVSTFVPTSYGSPTDEFAAEVVRLVNLERAKAGLKSLGTFQRLTDAAQIRAGELAKYYSHTRPDGTQFDTVMKEVGTNVIANGFGENIAGGQRTPAEVVEAWMNSPGHRANILRPDYSYIGVGYYYDANSTYKYHWAQNFCINALYPRDTTSWPGPEPEPGKPVYDSQGQLVTTDSLVKLTSTADSVTAYVSTPDNRSGCSAGASIKRDWLRLHGPDGYTIAWHVDDPDGVLEFTEMETMGASEGTNSPEVLDFTAWKPGTVRFTCTVTGVDGYVAKAYNTITFVSR